MEPSDIADDLILLVDAFNSWTSDRVLEDVRAGSAQQIRLTDGYVMQHLLVRRRRVTEIAELLGVSQQAASKQVNDMESRGLIERQDDPTDGRASLLALSSNGLDAVQAGRKARASIAREIKRILGEDGAAELMRHLRTVCEATGATEAMAARQRRPESAR